jgi:hypothetical protein
MSFGSSREAAMPLAVQRRHPEWSLVMRPIATIRAFRSDPSHENSWMDVGLRCRSGITYSQYHMVRLPGASAMSTNVTKMDPMVMTSTIGSSRSVALSTPTRDFARARHRRLAARVPAGNTEPQHRHLAKDDPNPGERVTRRRGIVTNETGCVTPNVGRSAASNACPVLPRDPVRARPVCFPDGPARGRLSPGTDRPVPKSR